MIKNGKEYVFVDGKAITTGYTLESVKQFHKCNAKVVTMERNSYELNGNPCIDRMRIFVSYNTAVLSYVERINYSNNKLMSVEIAFSKYAFHSHTTIRQVSRFLSEQGFSGYYNWLKKAYKLKTIYQPAEICTVYERQLDYPKYWKFDNFEELFWW